MSRRNRGEKPPYHEVVSLLLKKKNISYDSWSKQVITDICVSALQGENTEWKNKMLEQASIEMIAAEIQSQQQETNRAVHSDVQTRVN